MLAYGCTRLEVGVQSVYEDVARDTNRYIVLRQYACGTRPSSSRGHTVKAVSESFRMAKDSGFKVVSHMMPNLPNVDLERDLNQFKVTPDLNRKSSPSFFCRSFSKILNFVRMA